MAERKQTIALRLPKHVAAMVEALHPNLVEKILQEGINEMHNALPEAPAMIRTALLEDANKIITKDRHATHGKAENSFQTILSYWSVYLTKQFGYPIQLSVVDVSQMMVLFKVARGHNNPGNVDNWLDQIGYSAIAGELALREANYQAEAEAKSK